MFKSGDLIRGRWISIRGTMTMMNYKINKINISSLLSITILITISPIDTSFGLIDQLNRQGACYVHYSIHITRP